jgi:hypothetical protein
MTRKRVLVPPMLTSLMQTGMASMDGREFTDHGPCPACGGEVSGYDIREKFFATISEAGVTRDIHVKVKRFRCRSCGKLCYARSPFYPGTRLGLPVVDLCVTFSKEMPYNRVAEVLGAMGIVVDRGTVKLCRHRRRHRSATEFGFRLLSQSFRSPLGLGLQENGFSFVSGIRLTVDRPDPDYLSVGNHAVDLHPTGT